jgi:Fe2+ or Zn2+ uptake regulation protein
MSGAFTVEDLARAVRAQSQSIGASAAGTATVYRAIASMESAGFVTRVGSRDAHVLYAHCTLPSHHHHVVCDGCGRVASAPCPLESLDLSAPHDNGFTITRHEVTMYGLCHDCGHRENHDEKEHA